MAISPCIFYTICPEKDHSWGGHFPLEFRAHLYIFGISGARRMGKYTELKSNTTFYFFAPPPNKHVRAHFVVHMRKLIRLVHACMRTDLYQTFFGNSWAYVSNFIKIQAFLTEIMIKQYWCLFSLIFYVFSKFAHQSSTQQWKLYETCHKMIPVLRNKPKLNYIHY